MGTSRASVEQMYVDESQVQTGYSTSNSKQDRRILLNENAVEYTTNSLRTYEYGTKRQLFGNRAKRDVKNTVQSGMKITPWKSISKVIQNKR